VLSGYKSTSVISYNLQHSMPGHIKLLSNKVWFSCLLQENVMWHLPVWSAL